MSSAPERPSAENSSTIVVFRTGLGRMRLGEPQFRDSLPFPDLEPMQLAHRPSPWGSGCTLTSQEPELGPHESCLSAVVPLLELTSDQEGQPTQERDNPVVPSSDLDLALTAQIVVAWAGEGGEEPRLAWWQTDLVSEFGGEDLLRRLLPRTFEWAMLQGVREAARRKDAELRAKASDPDQLVTLYRCGFALESRSTSASRPTSAAGALLWRDFPP